MAPKGWVSYIAFWYDETHGLTEAVDMDTNGGVTWARPT